MLGNHEHYCPLFFVEIWIDRAEMHDLKLRFLLFILLFFFPLPEKGKRMAKVVILSHAFLLDHLDITYLE